MHGCKLIFALLPVLALSGCSTIGADYADTPPAKAITAIATEYGKERVTSVATQNGASIYLPEKAADSTFEAALDYCYVRGGRAYDWNKGAGRACVSNQSDREIFVIIRSVDRASDMVVLNVVEFTTTNGRAADDYLKYSFGYTTLAEKQRQQVEAIETERLGQEIKRQHLIEKRISERDKVAYRGAQVCKKVESMSILGATTTTLVGVVEQVEGNRIKVFVERAMIATAPGLSPGGFQQHYAWVNIWDVFPCS